MDEWRRSERKERRAGSRWIDEVENGVNEEEQAPRSVSEVAPRSVATDPRRLNDIFHKHEALTSRVLLLTVEIHSGVNTGVALPSMKRSQIVSGF